MNSKYCNGALKIKWKCVLLSSLDVDNFLLCSSPHFRELDRKRKKKTKNQKATSRAACLLFTQWFSWNGNSTSIGTSTSKQYSVINCNTNANYTTNSGKTASQNGNEVEKVIWTNNEERENAKNKRREIWFALFFIFFLLFSFHLIFWLSIFRSIAVRRSKVAHKRQKRVNCRHTHEPRRVSNNKRKKDDDGIVIVSSLSFDKIPEYQIWMEFAARFVSMDAMVDAKNTQMN